MTWQPIETAPKDGQRILVYTPYDEICVVAWNKEGRRPGWIIYGTAFDAAYDLGGNGQTPSAPTHWMPLPEPPK